MNAAIVALLFQVAASGVSSTVGGGLVPAASPLTLNLGTLFESGFRDVSLAPNQNLELRVTGLAGRRGEARPEVTLARCRIQQAYAPAYLRLDGLWQDHILTALTNDTWRPA